jgi:hypothetical protein
LLLLLLLLLLVVVVAMLPWEGLQHVPAAAESPQRKLPGSPILAVVPGPATAATAAAAAAAAAAGVGGAALVIGRQLCPEAHIGARLLLLLHPGGGSCCCQQLLTQVEEQDLSGRGRQVASEESVDPPDRVIYCVQQRDAPPAALPQGSGACIRPHTTRSFFHVCTATRGWHHLVSTQHSFLASSQLLQGRAPHLIQRHPRPLCCALQLLPNIWVGCCMLLLHFLEQCCSLGCGNEILCR